MTKRALAIIFCILLGPSAFASTWHFTWVGSDEARYFFDADTVEKNRDITTLWIKTVRINTPDVDGSWARALRWQLNCSKRTVQGLAWSTYSKDGKFITSNSTPTQETAVIPDTTGESMLKLACEVGFPQDASASKHYKVVGNDIFQATKNFIENQKSQVDVAPK